jgi:hypothetical protein
MTANAMRPPSAEKNLNRIANITPVVIPHAHQAKTSNVGKEGNSI